MYYCNHGAAMHRAEITAKFSTETAQFFGEENGIARKTTCAACNRVATAMGALALTGPEVAWMAGGRSAVVRGVCAASGCSGEEGKIVGLRCNFSGRDSEGLMQLGVQGGILCRRDMTLLG